MPIRILVVDDSVVIRRLLSSTLSEVPGLEVIATAALGKIALAKIAQCNPDVVILDVEMPDMDGIETLKRIRKDSPRLPVIMFSTKTERGAVATIEALTCGASDYVSKPSNAGNALAAMARVREEMVPKIRALAGGSRPALYKPPSQPLETTKITKTMPIAVMATTGVVPRSATTTGRTPIARPVTQAIARPKATTASPVLINDGPIRLSRPVGPRPPVEIVAVGASTGGPNALSLLLSQLPADFPVPVVIVQHMLATFTRHFADRLASQCTIKIVEAVAGTTLAPGHVYIARGDYHLLAERASGRAGPASLAMNQDRAENFCRPAVDVLFRSVAQTFGAGALAVVLTGMGHDGLLGCGAIRDAGGDVIVQDEQSSVVWGMPGFVARAGLASQVIALDQLAAELRRKVAHGGTRAAGALP
jgi:two-component system, chemotaxis family, protein-glutamate methylesterase/glutaminase